MLSQRNKFLNSSCILCRCFSSKRQKEEIIVPQAKRIAEPWSERKGVWKSTFSYFAPRNPLFGADMIRVLQTPIDLSPKNVRKWYNKKVEEQEEWNQKFNDDRLEALGPDLAAAHFIVHRGGAIRFYNEKEWLRQNEDKTINLPRKYVSGLFLEAIDCKGMQLRTIAVDNILDLPKLRWLSLQGNSLIDDWNMDSISGSYGNTLQYLDISHCPQISYRALSCFYRFQKLDTLIVEGIANDPEFKLSCMMLEDLKPMLTIKGIDHDKIQVKQKKIKDKIKSAEQA